VRQPFLSCVSLCYVRPWPSSKRTGKKRGRSRGLETSQLSKARKLFLALPKRTCVTFFVTFGNSGLLKQHAQLKCGFHDPRKFVLNGGSCDDSLLSLLVMQLRKLVNLSTRHLLTQ